MIFVTVGTNEAPFDRLLQAVDDLSPTEELVVQYGASSVRPKSATLYEFLPFEGIVEHVQRARVVVTHAGVGSVMVALAAARRPVVLPRLRQYGEAVDDHQLAFAERFAATGHVVLLPSEAALAAALDNGTGPGRSRDFDEGALVDEVRAFIANAVARPAHALLGT
jgi:UDP-N-acetylglucosamine transferase subunit ALG13